MRRRLIIAVGLAAALVSAIGCNRHKIDPAQEQYGVFSAFLNHEASQATSSFKVGPDCSLIRNQTATLYVGEEKTVLGPLASALEPVSKEMLEKYLSANRGSHPLTNNFQVSAAVSLVPEADTLQPSALPETNSYIEFSSVGFDAGFTEALFHVQRRACPLCGGGLYVWMVRDKAGRWVINKTYADWTS